MKTIKTFTISLILITIIFSCSEDKILVREYNKGINIIPAPQSIEITDNQYFTLGSNTQCYVSSERLEQVAGYFIDKIKQSTSYSLRVNNNKSSNTIIFNLDESYSDNKEAYKLIVERDKIEILSSTEAGIFYGVQSLLQLLPAEIESPNKIELNSLQIPELIIEDYPRFSYRGVHIDVCRHFVPIEFLKKQIDVLSLFKINKLHLHLSDDQAWRIEIKKYPKLTEIGSSRIEGEGFEYKGHYTQDEIRSLVKYASDRFISIIPEIELPGHELAAISAYPELSCKTKSISPRIIWGVEDIVMCPGKEFMFEFLENVFDEICDLFPSEYIHIGGDECPKISWKTCKNCQKLIKEKGFSDDNKFKAEDYLQSYVIQRAEEMLVKHNRKIIGWDEILDGELASGATVMSWRGKEGGIAAAMQNHNAIMSPSNAGMYLDHYQGDSKIEPVAIGGYTTLERVYSYDPIPEELIKINKDNYIIGVQTNVWSEYLYQPESFEYMMYPRYIALSEIAWTNKENKDFNDFARRINNALVRLDMHNINYHIPLAEQENGSCNFIAFTDSTKAIFKTSRPIKIVYTTDGSDPDSNSMEYLNPIKLTKTSKIKIATVLPSGKMSKIREITYEKQNYKSSCKIEDVENGLSMRVCKGMFLNSSELDADDRIWSETKIHNLSELRSVVESDESMRGVEHYAAIAEGYIDIAEDGVYFFSSNNNEVWIDDNLLIDNNNEVKRFSRNDKSIALASGLHKIKIVFLSHIIGGWPSIWDNADVLIRQSDEQEFMQVKSDILFRDRE